MCGSWPRRRRRRRPAPPRRRPRPRRPRSGALAPGNHISVHMARPRPGGVMALLPTLLGLLAAFLGSGSASLPAEAAHLQRRRQQHILGSGSSAPRPLLPAAANQQVKRVYVLFSNHLDIGYTNNINGSCAGAVINRYFHDHFPNAIEMAARFRANKSTARRYRWMTQSWLVSTFRNCNASVVNVGGRAGEPSDIICPNSSSVAAFEAAAKRGDITWHAFPHNSEPEMLDATLFDAGLNLTFEQDAAIEHAPRQTMSVRDVPGLTRAAIPLLVKRGVRAVSVGENGACASVNVPTAFVWRDAPTQTQLLALFHPNGYGAWPPQASPPPASRADGGADADDGPSIVYNAGTGKAPVDPANDCAFVPHSGVAICYAWRGDNAGPAQTTQEVDAIYDVSEPRLLFPVCADWLD